MFASSSSNYGVQMHQYQECKDPSLETSTSEFLNSSLYTKLVEDEASREDIELMKSMFIGQQMTLYIEDGGQHLVHVNMCVQSGLDSQKLNNYAIRIHHCGNEKPDSFVSLKQISDVFAGNQAFPKTCKPNTKTTQCWSLKTKPNQCFHFACVSQDVRGQFMQGLKRWFEVVKKAITLDKSTVASSLQAQSQTQPQNIPPKPTEMITIPRSLYTDLVHHLQQANLKLGQITHSMNGKSQY